MARQFVFPRPHVQGLFGRGRDTGEITVFMGSVVLGVVWALLAPGLVVKGAGLVAFPALGALCVFVPYRGRTFYRWWEIERSYKRLLRRGPVWLSDAPELGRRGTGEARDMEPPPGVGRLTWWTVGAAQWMGPGDLCVVLHHDRKVLTATLEIEPSQSFQSLDSNDKEGVLASYQGLLTEAANGRNWIKRLASYARVVPSDPEAHHQYVLGHRDPDADARLQESYRTLESTVAVDAEDQAFWVTAQVDFSLELAEEAQVYGGVETGMARVVANEVRDLVTRLEDRGLRVLRALGEPELAAVIHSLYDPSWRIGDTIGMNQVTAWPAELDARDRHFVAARSWETDEPWLLATAWWMQLPQTPVGVNFLAPLLVDVRDVIRTTSVVMDLVPSDVALDRLLADYTIEAGKSVSAARAGQISDPRTTLQLERLQEATAELATNAAGVNVAGYVTIAARSERELEQAKRSIGSAAVKAQLRLQWCDGEHYRAVVNALPFAQGLRED